MNLKGFNKTERLLTVIKEVPCQKMLLDELAHRINEKFPPTYRIPPKSIAFFINALQREHKLFVCKEVICCQRYYTISVNPNVKIQITQTDSSTTEQDIIN